MTIRALARPRETPHIRIQAFLPKGRRAPPSPCRPASDAGPKNTDLAGPTVGSVCGGRGLPSVVNMLRQADVCAWHNQGGRELIDRRQLDRARRLRAQKIDVVQHLGAIPRPAELGFNAANLDTLTENAADVGRRSE